jgi:hypothetical protein
MLQVVIIAVPSQGEYAYQTSLQFYIQFHRFQLSRSSLPEQCLFICAKQAFLITQTYETSRPHLTTLNFAGIKAACFFYVFKGPLGGNDKTP